MNKVKLVRSRKNKMVSGVLGGLESLINVDATILRVISALLIFSTGVLPGLIVYLLLAIIIPLEEDKHEAIMIEETKQTE